MRVNPINHNNALIVAPVKNSAFVPEDRHPCTTPNGETVVEIALTASDACWLVRELGWLTPITGTLDQLDRVRSIVEASYLLAEHHAR